ncbi:hypothetical protein [Virgibacillus proomii]|nr:hypothetical protein [Virgibacillus proomii]MBU5265955.1 hypothetical protein [Virgibacillus proomii]
MNNIPKEYQSSFSQGMAFGYEARRLQDNEFWQNSMDQVNETTKQTILS